MKTRFIIAIVTAVTLVPIAVPAFAQDSWGYTISPYLWMPTIGGTLRYQLPPALGDRIDIEVGPEDYLSHLNLTAMVAGEARKGKFSLASDLLYLDLSSKASNVRSIEFAGGRVPVSVSLNRATESSLKGLQVGLVGGYSINGDADSPVDLVAGVRYFGVDASSEWELTATVPGPTGGQFVPIIGGVSKKVDLWDGIVGIRGRAKVGERWHLPYYADAGTGSSSLTWQAMLGVTYAYGWGDVGLVYRHLEYDQDEDGLMQNMSFSGPAFTASFHF